ncbi:MAG: ATPase [Deltaproteobacteria bacterium]|jgi:V/A-type H+-transporting ATPase subunit I|nr:ATPase [Deltaproteobacteria bacterium]
MIIRMAKVEIVGPKQDLLSTLDLLHNRGIFQPDPQLMERVELVDDEQLQTLVLDENELRERSFFQGLQERVTNLLELLPEVNNGISPLQPLPVMGLLDELVDQHLATARDLVRSLNECRRNAEDLQHDLSFWEALEPLLENLPKTSNLEIFGVTIRDSRQLHNLDSLLQERTQGRCYISSTTTTDGTLIGLIATDKAMADGLRQALTAEKVPELSLPEELVGLPLPQRIMALHDKLKTQLGQCNQFEGRLMDMSRRWRPIYRRALVWLEERLALYRATATAYTTRLCFIVQGWMANHDVASLQDDLNRSFSGRVVLEQLAILEEDLDQVPVMLRNPGYFAPFEILSRLLPLPKYSSYDPTPLIGLFFPVLFGMILGDIGYGLILLLLAFFLAKYFPAHTLTSDIGKVLGIAALYTLVFGILYGELFGDLGKTWLGLHPVWFDRGKAVVPMIVFSLTVGVVHILLGMTLGALTELRRHQPRKALVKLAMLVAVILMVLALVGWFYPQSWLSTGPLLIGVGILMPVLIAAEGLLAPLELLKTMGNIISYVRIMAIGFSSILLAVVANRLGGMTGDIMVGILVGGTLHAFNLLLGVFAPTVHSLRLHYVEFFSKFLDLGGRRFEPWQKRHP